MNIHFQISIYTKKLSVKVLNSICENLKFNFLLNVGLFNNHAAYLGMQLMI